MTDKISYSEFRKMQDDSSLKQFEELFELRCKKCNSTNVEIFGKLNKESSYYNDVDCTGLSVIKCHDCGNAKTFTFDYDWGSFEEIVLEKLK
jgi:hypothetical protein